jgi:hypothetical protein
VIGESIQPPAQFKVDLTAATPLAYVVTGPIATSTFTFDTAYRPPTELEKKAIEIQRDKTINRKERRKRLSLLRKGKA